MSLKAMNFRMEESEILDIKHVAGVFNMSVTELIKKAIKKYLRELKEDPFYRLTANVQNASDEETAEILAEIENAAPDELEISSVKRFTI